jgi:hypothetical protein
VHTDTESLSVYALQKQHFNNRSMFETA